MDRGDFLRLTGLAFAGFTLAGRLAACGSGSPSAGLTSATGASPGSPPGAGSASSPSSPGVVTTPSPSGSPSAARAAAYLGVATGKDYPAVTRAAIDAIGGIERFVKQGDDVIIKPNICVGYYGPEYGATTNPRIVAALVDLCVSAGAGRVRVMDNPFGSPAPTAYQVSGIAAAVKQAGGRMEIMNPVKFRTTRIPHGKAITSYPIYRDIMTADLVINVPIAKHHPLSRLTIAGKNLFGCVTNRQNLHFNIAQCTADLWSVITPGLTVVDASRIMVTNGPSGGSLSDVRVKDTVIASHDGVAADSYAARLFGLSGGAVPYVSAAAAMGLGTTHLNKIDIAVVKA